VTGLPPGENFYKVGQRSVKGRGLLLGSSTRRREKKSLIAQKEDFCIKPPGPEPMSSQGKGQPLMKEREGSPKPHALKKLTRELKRQQRVSWAIKRAPFCFKKGPRASPSRKKKAALSQRERGG